jgi:hypothetical protein
MGRSKVKLESGGDESSPCFRSFLKGKLSDKGLLTRIRNLLYVSTKDVLIILTSLVGTPNL